MDAKKKKQTAVGLWVLAGVLIISSGIKLATSLLAVVNDDRARYALDSIAFDVILLAIAIVCLFKASTLWREAKAEAVL